MVIERVRDEEHSIIDVVHIQLQDFIKAVGLPEEEFHRLEIEEVKKELLENYPDYNLVFASRLKNYEKHEQVGMVMRYVARGVKYFYP